MFVAHLTTRRVWLAVAVLLVATLAGLAGLAGLGVERSAPEPDRALVGAACPTPPPRSAAAPPPLPGEPLFAGLPPIDLARPLEVETGLFALG